jgi:hypothetical protein
MSCVMPPFPSLPTRLTEDERTELGKRVYENPDQYEGMFELYLGMQYKKRLEADASERLKRFGCCGDESQRKMREVVSCGPGPLYEPFHREVTVMCPWGWECPKGNISPFILLFGRLNACRKK